MKKRVSSKTVIGIVALLLLLAVGVGVVGHFTKGFTDWEIKDPETSEIAGEDDSNTDTEVDVETDLEEQA